VWDRIEILTLPTEYVVKVDSNEQVAKLSPNPLHTVATAEEV